MFRLKSRLFQPLFLHHTEMLEASLVEVRTITLEGLKPTWRTTKPEEVVVIDGEAYVRVAPSNFGLSSLIAADNDDVPDTMPKGISPLSISKGLSSLTHMRNQKQAEALSESGTQCSLFEGGPRKKTKIPRHQLEAMRRAPQSLTLNLEIDGTDHEVEVLRPVHPTDNIFVAYKADMIAALLHYIRRGGFSEPVHRSRPAEIPKGIHSTKGGFVVKYKKDDGTNGFKRCKTLDESLAFHAEVLINATEADDNQEAAHAAENAD